MSWDDDGALHGSKHVTAPSPSDVHGGPNGVTARRTMDDEVSDDVDGDGTDDNASDGGSAAAAMTTATRTMRRTCWPITMR